MATGSLLTRHDSDGTLSWSKSFDGISPGGPIAVDDAGSAFIVETDPCPVVVKVGADGTEEWRAKADLEPVCDFGFSLLATSGSAIYAIGAFTRARTGIVVSRFASDGAHEWTFVYEVDAETTWLFLTDADVDAEGALVVTAGHAKPLPYAYDDYLVLKIEPTGELAWERLFDAGATDIPISIVAGPEGRVTVGGLSDRETDEGGGVRDYMTIQLDTAGNQLWTSRVERETWWGHFGWLPLSPVLAADSIGNVYLAGSVGPYGAPELLLVKYGPTGTELLNEQFAFAGEARRILIVDDGRVYIAAPVIVDGRRQGGVFAFTAAGELSWHSITDSALHVLPAALGFHAGGLVLTAAEDSFEEGSQEQRNAVWVGVDLDGDIAWTAGEPARGLADLYCGSIQDYQDPINRRGSCLEAGPNGSIFVAGTRVSVSDSYSQFLEHRALKIGAGGTVEWSVGFSGSYDEIPSSGATALAVGEQGRVHVAGPNWVTVTLDADGGQEWVDRIDIYPGARGLETDSAGGVYVAGRSQGNASPYAIDILLAKYAADGDALWTRSYAGPGGGDDDVSAIAVLPGDHIAYVGQASVAARLDALARAYDTFGNVLFSRTFDAAGGDASLAALVAAGSDIVAAGRAKNATDFDVLVVRLDATGNIDWRRDLDGGQGDDEANAVAVDPMGNAYVAGRTWNGDDFDVLVAKLDPAGTELWRRAIDLGQGDDEAWAAAFDSPGPGKTAGSLWVAGRASNGEDTDAMTLRLDPDGAELFRDVVAGTEQRDDEHYDLVIGPVPGHATVAGISAEIDESYNFQAIRYVTSPLDVDYDGETGALTDGILIQRWLFGFRGSVLETGAVDQALCVRCPAEQIDLHLSAIVRLLDVDGDGAAESLTDGTLVFRWLFGFRGATLVSGAVDLAHCTRCDAAAIEAHLEGLSQ